MNGQPVYWMGILVNIKTPVLFEVDLGNGYYIQSFSRDEGSLIEAHFSDITFGMSPGSIYKLPYQKYLLTNDTFHIISKKFVTPEQAIACETASEERLAAMRLFKTGNVHAPIRYIFSLNKDNTFRIYHSMYTTGFKTDEDYILAPEEIPHLAKHVKRIRLPFKDPVLQLAMQNFEASYCNNLEMSFLSAMIGLETLFHGQTTNELVYRVSRNTGVLLSEDFEHGHKICNDIKRLYDIRSSLVHSGKAKKLKKDDLQVLRDYLRQAILKINNSGKMAADMHNIYLESGFGSLKDFGLIGKEVQFDKDKIASQLEDSSFDLTNNMRGFFISKSSNLKPLSTPVKVWLENDYSFKLCIQPIINDFRLILDHIVTEVQRTFSIVKIQSRVLKRYDGMHEVTINFRLKVSGTDQNCLNIVEADFKKVIMQESDGNFKISSIERRDISGIRNNILYD